MSPLLFLEAKSQQSTKFLLAQVATKNIKNIGITARIVFTFANNNLACRVHGGHGENNVKRMECLYRRLFQGVYAERKIHKPLPDLPEV